MKIMTNIFLISNFQVIGVYPTPPPVATGPGLDRPIFVPGTDYGIETYTMNRTRMFYQDQVIFNPGRPVSGIYANLAILATL